MSWSSHIFLVDIFTYSFSTLSVVSGISFPSCFASAFVIILVEVFIPVSLSNSVVTFSSFSVNELILTVNVNDLVSFDSNSTFIPSTNSSILYVLVVELLVKVTSLPSSPTIDVPVGTSSLMITLPFPSPLFVAVRVYVIVSSSFKGVADALLVFSVVILATLVSTLGVSVSATFAAFFIDLIVSLLTVTTKDTSVFSPAFTGMFFHVIVPFFNSPGFVISVAFSVPSGTTSEIVVTASTSEVFSAVITYLTF